MTAPYRKKLIEVALPLPEINEGSKPETENPFLKGHPRAIHNWWARTPLSVSRAILFAQLIDDPGNDLPPDAARTQREKLIELIARLATWEATTDEELIATVRGMIAAQFEGRMPEFWDMFAGRASIPLEAQRLGLTVTSSDLNPVAVTIQRGLLEFPAAFAGRAAIHPKSEGTLVDRKSWSGTEGLAEDIRWYGKWIGEAARKRLSRIYPKGPDGKTVIGWLWARTVPSPDPSCDGVPVPLVRSFQLAGKSRQVWVVPKADRRKNTIDFHIAEDVEPHVEGTVSRKGAVCLLSGSPMPFSYVREQAKKGKMGNRLMAIVTEGDRCRAYHAPTETHVQAAEQASPSWRPDCEMPQRHPFRPPIYGMDNMGDLFTDRQLVALVTIADLIADTRASIRAHANGDEAYADAVIVYLACALSRMADYHCSLATWNPTNENVRNLFQRQSFPMAWDFCEANPIEGKLAYDAATEWVASSLKSLPNACSPATVAQLDARKTIPAFVSPPVVSTDPPYYDNISYADLADFFYVWLRRILRDVDPPTFTTVLTPKDPELIASPSRHGSMEAAEAHFRDGFQKVFKNVWECAHPDVPCTVYYAFKQEEDDSESDGNHRVSTGWETMLEGLVDAGFQITGTWPVRTTKKARAVARDANALASAVVLVARRRPEDAPQCSRREFLVELKKELPAALRHLQHGNIAPVDLAQAAIGPGMAVYSRYGRILETDGSSMTVRTALSLINQSLDETLAEQEGDFDPETAWAVAWFEQFGFGEGPFGDAEVLSRAKNTAINALASAGVVKAGAGKTRLFRVDELPPDWDPATDQRLTVWEMVHHLIRLMSSGGETAAAELVAKLGGAADAARELAYRLYSVCERRKRAAEALSYNSLVQSWPEISRLAREHGKARETQRQMFERE